MKRPSLTILFLCVSLCAFAQDYMDKIAVNACSCIESLTDTTDAEAYTSKLGICLIQAAEPYQKQLMKDYNINLENIDSEVGSQLGRIVGVKMVSKCPETVIALGKRVKSSTGTTRKSLAVSGQVTKIEHEPFVVFTVKDETGKLSRYYWLTFIKSDMEMTGEYLSLNGKNVSITYRTEDFFDPKLNEYRAFNVIERIE